MTAEERNDAARIKCHDFITQALGMESDDLLLGARLAAVEILNILTEEETEVEECCCDWVTDAVCPGCRCCLKVTE